MPTPGKIITIPCDHCGNDFQKPKKAIKYRTKQLPTALFFCSNDCYYKHLRTNIEQLCVICGKQFYCSLSQLKERNRKHCSRQCKAIAQSTKKIGSSRARTGLKQKAQTKANLYARLRDCGGKDGGTTCISCGIWFAYGDMDGGHFIPTTSSAVRYDERNINAQCRKCNRYLSGNSRHYLRGMIRKYGQEVVDELEVQEFTTRKWTVQELLQIVEDFDNKIKQLT